LFQDQIRLSQLPELRGPPPFFFFSDDLCLTLTLDNGKKKSCHADLASLLGCIVCFADPGCASTCLKRPTLRATLPSSWSNL